MAANIRDQINQYWSEKEIKLSDVLQVGVEAGQITPEQALNKLLVHGDKTYTATPDEKYVVHAPSKHFTYINNSDHPVELKFPEGHSFTMPPGMSMMIPPPIETTFVKWEDYHYGMKRRPVFVFAGQVWHMREPGESPNLKPININFSSKKPVYDGKLLSDVTEDEIGLIDTGHRMPNYALLNPLDLYKKEVMSKLKPGPISMWLENIRYHMRESKFKIRRRPSHFNGMYNTAPPIDINADVCPNRCPFCGDSDGPGNCTEQANCLNVSMEAEEKMRQREAFRDHGAYPAPGDKEQIDESEREKEEQSRRESTVRGFLGYRPKPKRKK